MNSNAYKISMRPLFVLGLGLALCFTLGCSKQLSGNSNDQVLQQKRQLQQQTSVNADEQKQQMMAQQEELSQAKIYMEHFNNGKQAHNQGDYAKAISEFNACVGSKPDFAEGWGWRGLSKFKSGNTSGACEDWSKAIQLGSVQFQDYISQNCN